jgi:hypothetical protein
MNDQKFSNIVLTYKNGIYAGKWRRTEYSVTVRYKQREVSISAGGLRQKAIAKALMMELIENESQRRSALPHRPDDRMPVCSLLTDGGVPTATTTRLVQ